MDSAGHKAAGGSGSSARSGLASMLTAAATHAARRLDGGVVLLFVRSPIDSSDTAARLFTAAGLAAPEAARNASERKEVIQAVESGKQVMLPLSVLGRPGPGSVVVIPLYFDDRFHGAVVAGGNGSGEDILRSLSAIAESVALRLDHAHLARQARLAEEALQKQAIATERKNEEMLELSEALFTQDIELLRSHDKLGKVEKLKNDFIEKMSRELRTPLNSIIEAIIQVLAGENETLSASAQESLRDALDEGTAFLRTLQNILDLWCLKQGELPLEIQEVSFREVVEEAIFSVQDTLGSKPVRIEKQLADPFPKIKTDLAKVNQIVFLLLDNAVKFTNAGAIQIGARIVDDQLICKIQDTGIGICPDDQQFIFDEFYQVDEVSSAKYRGAGLGLTLVRDLVVLLEGTLALSSDAGAGTQVTFQIPIQPLG